jgi:sulfate/thiosulfate-binding protein
MEVRCAIAASLVGLAAILLSGCGEKAPDEAAPEPVQGTTRITFAGFSVAREAYGRAILPAFKARWAADHPGRNLEILETYEGSGVQTRSILGGLRVDVAALTLEPEIGRLVEAGLASKDWKNYPGNGFPAYSTVVLAVRPGNPKGITTWEDLTRADVRVLMASPDTSGSAQWNVAAIYGAAKRSGRTEEEIFQMLRGVRRRVRVYGKSGRESVQQFVHGVGDVLVAWENEALSRQHHGDPLEVVWPPSTIRMEPPVALLGKPSPPAIALVTFLNTPEAQQLYAENFFRPRNKKVAAEFRETLPPIRDLFTIDDIGGWSEIRKTLFSEEGLWPRAAR